MTSLTGFDALLRGKQVIVHGRPFYAGWGLTQDLLPVPRRQRYLSLDELVAGALLHYPLYWDPLLKGYTSVALWKKEGLFLGCAWDGGVGNGVNPWCC